MLFRVVLGIYCYISVSTVLAQPVRSFGMPSNGEAVEINLTESDRTAGKLILVASSEGNVSHMVDLNLLVPDGTTARLASRFLGGADVQSALSQPESWTPMHVYRNEVNYLLASLGQMSAASIFSPAVCATLTPEQIAAHIANYSSLLGRAVTFEELCGQSGEQPGGAPPVLGGTITYDVRALLRKDTCGTADTATYLMRIDIDLSTVDPSSFTNGIKIRASLKVDRFKGSSAASIKPVSDGRDAPNPILLMSSLGSYAGNGEKIQMVRWKNGKIKRDKKLPIRRYIYYRGQVLTLSLLTKVLTGGRATFELTNGNEAYSVCFQAVRRRQYRNGYQH